MVVGRKARIACSTEGSKGAVDSDMVRSPLGRFDLPALGVDLHHRQGEGDGHGRLEPMRQSNDDDQDGPARARRLKRPSITYERRSGSMAADGDPVLL